MKPKRRSRIQEWRCACGIWPAGTPALRLLTGRECEVLRWITHGKTDPEIAGILEICSPTASTHVHNILTKLDVINRIIAVGEVVCVIICGRPRSAR